MLHEFIRSNRDVIMARVRMRVASRTTPEPTKVELANGIPVFLDQLGEALEMAKSSDVVDHEQIRQSAGRHGHDLLRLGLTIEQVVHDYGDVCQVITQLAIEKQQEVSSKNFSTLNLCLDDAIAGAVAEYAHQQEITLEARGTERLGVLAHEMRNLLGTAMISFELISKGVVAANGLTADMHRRSLLGLRELIARSLADVRLDAGIEHLEPILVAEFIDEIKRESLIQSAMQSLELTVTSVDRTVSIEGDRHILAGAISNLLQNAFKFTRAHTTVSLTVRTTADRVLFDVEDECGGLPPGKAEELFAPFSQRGADRSGMGLGLSICFRAAKVHHGELRVRDLPGKGCVFTLDLPRKPPPLSVVGSKKPQTGSPGAAEGTGGQRMATSMVQAN